jgi:hypothetical protein
MQSEGRFRPVGKVFVAVGLKNWIATGSQPIVRSSEDRTECHRLHLKNCALKGRPSTSPLKERFGVNGSMQPKGLHGTVKGFCTVERTRSWVVNCPLTVERSWVGNQRSMIVKSRPLRARFIFEKMRATASVASARPRCTEDRNRSENGRGIPPSAARRGRWNPTFW